MKYTKKYNKKRKPKTHKKRPNRKSRKSRKHAKKRGGFIFFDSSKQTINTKQEAFNKFKHVYPPEKFENGQLLFEGNIAMAIDFENLYDVIKDATKPCGKDTSFTGSEHINECTFFKKGYLG